jgi:uncharacterized membrane protein
MNARHTAKILKEQFGAAFPFVADSVKVAMVDSVVLQVMRQQDTEDMQTQTAAWMQERIESLRAVLLAEMLLDG